MSRLNSGWAVAAVVAVAAGSYVVWTAFRGRDNADGGLGAVEQRLAALERSLEARLTNLEEERAAPLSRDLMVEEGSSLVPDPSPVGGEGADDPLALIDARVTSLEERIEGLEKDPIRRGYAFLSSENAALRREAIRTLVRIAKIDPEAKAAIRRALADSSPIVRREALEALGDIRDRETVPQMMELLADEDAAVRRRAIRSLGQCNAAEAGLAVAQQLADADDRVREAAADILGRLKSAESGEQLLQALRDPNEVVRGEAIASLGEAGVKAAVPALLKMYEEGGGRNRMRIVFALQKLGDETAYRQEVDRLSRTALGDPDERARSQAIRELASFAQTEARAIARQVVEDPSALVRREAERVLR